MKTYFVTGASGAIGSALIPLLLDDPDDDRLDHDIPAPLLSQAQRAIPYVLRLTRGQAVWLKPRQVKVFNVPGVPLEEGGSGI